MEANTVQAFTAIKQFVDALAEIYDKKKGISPLGLYQRLLTFVNADTREEKNIQKFFWLPSGSERTWNYPLTDICWPIMNIRAPSDLCPLYPRKRTF